MASCDLWESFTRPLWKPPKSIINPCFLASVGTAVAAGFTAFVLIQLLLLVTLNHYGPYRIKYAFGSPFNARSVGFRQLVKLNSVFLSGVLWLILATNPTNDGAAWWFSWSAVTVHAVAFVLHVIEPTRSVVASASLLLWWLWHTIFVAVLVAQATWTKHPVFDADTSQWSSVLLTVQLGLLINSFAVFALETFVYTPSRQLADYYEVNGWDYHAVHNFFSQLLFTFMEPTIRDVHATNTIDIKDVVPVEVRFSNEVLQNQFDKVWRPDRSLGLVLFQLYWFDGLLAFLFDSTDMVFGISQSFLLQRFILFFSNYDPETTPIIEGFALCTAIFVTAVIKFCSFNRFFVKVFDIWYSAQSQMTSTVYRKSLRLSKSARKEKSNGDIVNILSTDVNTVAGAPSNIIDILITPVRLIAALTALIHILGVSTLAGIVIGGIIVPLNSLVTMRIQKYYTKSQKIKDERVRLTSEILSTIKSIKLYAWEKPLLNRLFSLRNDQELKIGRTMGLLNAVSMFCWSCVPFVIQCVSLVTFTYIGKIPLTPSVVFPAISLFSILTDPFLMVPYLFTGIIQANVSLGRVKELLTLPEADNKQVERLPDPVADGNVAVDIQSATFEYGDGTSDVALTDIDFEARKGQLTCIVGRVGSGKSSIIKSILGQLPVKQAKRVATAGTIAYAAQDPWIMNATVKENILFGRRYDKKFYQLTCAACQLTTDFDLLPDGDLTVVGEKGISLSGGQKARISLARAVYSKADIVLLDDVLSAVDVHVGKAITSQVLSTNGLLATKTVVLATNAISVLPLASKVYFVESGKITESGTYDDIKSTGQMAEIIKEFGKQDRQQAAEAEEDAEIAHVKDLRVLEHAAEATAEVGSVVSYVGDDLEENPKIRRQSTRPSFVSYSHDYDVDEDRTEPTRTGNNEEVGQKGSVKFSVYMEYFRACNFHYLIFYVLSYGTHVALNLLSQYILKMWSQKNLEAGDNVNPLLYVSMYAGFGIIASLCTLVGAFIVWTYCVIKGSTYFHDKMAWAVVKSPMQFFDTTPLGRILNRFSEDISVIDSQIMWMCMGMVDFSLEALGLLSVVVYNLPAMAIIIFILFFLYNMVRSYFIPASRELKRLSSARKSPIYAHLQESLTGIDTIKAYQAVDRFFYRNRDYVDKLIKVQFSNAYCNRWLSMRLQTISSVIIYFSTIFIWLSLRTSQPFSPSLVGFVMVNAMGVTWTLNSIIRFWANLESQSVAVERVIEYCNLPSEGQSEDLVVVTPDASWPSGGAIEFKDYTCKYRDNLDPVLKGINVSIPAQAKVGIVGRTGAGKSTLSLALFRLIEASSGHIEIDSLNTSDMSLYELRHHLNIIPQDSSSVEGTVRQNLDPLAAFSDERLWQVLEMAHLKTHVESMKTKKGQTEDSKDTKKDDDSDDDDVNNYDHGLDAQIFEGGSNLSSGQRQLMSLARSLLNPSKVLVLDEATAAVDVQTDKIIQQTIRSEFKDRTILTIAHRLETVMDCDYILVLANGQVSEFDSPQNLLNDPSSVFSGMVKEHHN